MSRFGVLLLLLLVLAVPAQADAPAPLPRFNGDLATQVYAAGLDFIRPRALEPVNVPELTVWGLHGLTALDPDLTATLHAARLVLSAPNRTLYAAPAPKTLVPAAWAAAAVAMTEAAWQVSPAVRHAGQQGVIQNFFDEIFNHLDPYSRYVPPGQAAEDAEERIGTAGIGVTLVQRRGAVSIQAMIPTGPGAQAGLQIGDQIIAIDGQAVARDSLRVVTARIAGPEGTKLRLSWRTARGRLHSATIQRALVPPETVYDEQVAGMLILRITAFNRSTDAGFTQTLEQAAAARQPPDGLVIDLRNNRGGLLEEAVTVADTLLPPGIVATTRGRDPAASTVWRSSRGELARGMPVVVLVDGRTASAAEVLAAALADRGRAVVVGSSTFGKGLVQTFTRLPDGGELYVTWSRVLAPLGWPLQGLGVLPQVCTSLGLDAVERQLQALAQGEQPMAAAVEREREARAPVPPTKVVAIRSACPAAEGRELDLEVAHFLIENPAAYAAALLPPAAGMPGIGP